MRKKIFILFTSFIVFFVVFSFTSKLSSKSIDSKKAQVSKKQSKLALKTLKPGSLKLETIINPANNIAAIGSKALIKAFLKNKINGNPIQNQILQFYVDNKHIGDGITDSNGKAKVKYLVPGFIGKKLIEVKFDGKGNLLPSSGTGFIGIIKSSTKLTITYTKSGSYIKLSGSLKRITDMMGLAQRGLKLYLDGNYVKMVAITGLHGKYTGNYTIPVNNYGNRELKIKFDGDNFHLGSTNKVNVKITKKTVVLLSVSGPDTAKAGDTLFFLVSAKEQITNLPVKDITISFGTEKKTSSLGTAGFFYKIPNGVGIKTFYIHSFETDKYYKASCSLIINVFPKDN